MTLRSFQQSISETLIQNKAAAAIAPSWTVGAAITTLVDAVPDIIGVVAMLVGIYASIWVAKKHRAERNKINLEIDIERYNFEKSKEQQKNQS